MATKELDIPPAEDRDGVVDLVAQQLQAAVAPVTEFGRRSSEAYVRAVIILKETGRRWYVVETRVRSGQLEVMGYEPRCQYHSPGDGWFVLPSTFFVRASEATGDELEVRVAASLQSVAESDDLWL